MTDRPDPLYRGRPRRPPIGASEHTRRLNLKKYLAIRPDQDIPEGIPTQLAYDMTPAEEALAREMRHERRERLRLDQETAEYEATQPAPFPVEHTMSTTLWEDET